jgi:hypothetical protein
MNSARADSKFDLVSSNDLLVSSSRQLLYLAYSGEMAGFDFVQEEVRGKARSTK